MYILAMLAATVVVPCQTGHVRAPGSSGSGVVAVVPGRGFVVRLRGVRAAAVLRSVHRDDVWRVARCPRPRRLLSREQEVGECRISSQPKLQNTSRNEQ